MRIAAFLTALSALVLTSAAAALTVDDGVSLVDYAPGRGFVAVCRPAGRRPLADAVRRLRAPPGGRADCLA